MAPTGYLGNRVSRLDQCRQVGNRKVKLRCDVTKMHVMEDFHDPTGAAVPFTAMESQAINGVPTGASYPRIDVLHSDYKGGEITKNTQILPHYPKLHTY